MVVDSHAEVHGRLTLCLGGCNVGYPMRGQTFPGGFTVLLTVCLGLLQPLAALDPAPYFGTWNQVFGRYSAPSPYKRITSRIEPWEDGLRVTYDLVGKRGGVTHMEWTGKFDGQDYPMQGVDNVLTNAYRKIDDRSYEIVIKVEGRVQATARVAVSPDGKSLQVATSTPTASGQSVTTITVYARQ